MATYYFTKSKKAAATMAQRIADGKYGFILWLSGGTCNYYGANGVLSGEAWTDVPQDADAVEVWPAMTDDELKNARRIAATRETLRSYENKARTILRKPEAERTAADRRELIRCINVAYHSTGKIEGCASVDGCASCAFCRDMIAAAEKNPLIICSCCYADRDKYKEASWRRHTLNAEILSQQLFTAEELKALDISSNLCRFNEDGDTVNETHARNLLRITYTRPAVNFGYWFKNKVAVEAGLHAEGFFTREQLPENIRFIYSSPVIGIPATPTWFTDAVFTVYPDEATTAAAIAAGAWECNGRRCRACDYNCYLMQRRTESPLHIAEFLRTGKANRERIMKLYNNLIAQRAALHA